MTFNKAIHLNDSWAPVGDAARTTAFLAQVVANGTTLDATHIAAYKALMNGGINDGWFAKFDGLYINATQDEPTVRLNLIQNAFNLTTAGVPFVADRGSTSGGPFYDTGFVPSTQAGLGSQYQLNSCHIMGWSNATGDDPFGSQMVGATGASGYVAASANSTINGFYLNDTSSATENTSAGKGFYLGSRSSATQCDGYWGLSSALTHTINESRATTGLPDVSIGVCAWHGFAAFGKQVSAASFGGSLSATDAANFYSRIQAFMTAVGN